MCFQVTPQTSEAFQKAFGEELIIKNMPFLYIQDDGGLGCGLAADEDYEQVIIAPEKFDSQKELMEFLVMGGAIINEETGKIAHFNSEGYLTGNVELDTTIEDFLWLPCWKPRIDKPKPKWFLAWATDKREVYPSPDNSQMYMVKKAEGSGFYSTHGHFYYAATPLTDTELAEFGLKRIENDD